MKTNLYHRLRAIRTRCNVLMADAYCFQVPQEAEPYEKLWNRVNDKLCRIEQDPTLADIQLYV